MKTGIELITQERAEQIEKHGISIKQDVYINDVRQLVGGASTLIIYSDLHEQKDSIINRRKPVDWNSSTWLKMCKKPYKERLIIAGALIAAEIDRLQYSKD